MSNLKDIRRLEPITIELGGRVRSLQYDLNAFAELEKRYGSVNEAFKTLQEGKIKDVRTMLWAGLIHDEVILDEDGEPTGYKITPYEVGRWVNTPELMNEVSKQIAKAMAADQPEPDATTIKPASVKPTTAPDGSQIAQVVETPEDQEAKNG